MSLKRQTPEDKFDKFTEELGELLNKYNACIEVYMEGDTHGIYESGLDVELRFSKSEGDSINGWRDFKLDRTGSYP